MTAGFGFGPLPRPRQQEPVDLTPEELARMFNPQRLAGTGASMTLNGTGDLPAGIAEGMNAGGGAAAFGGLPPVMPQEMAPPGFDQRFGAAPPGQGFGLPDGAVDALRVGLSPQGQPSPMNVPLPPERPSAASLGPLSLGPLPPASPTLSRQRSSDSALGPTSPQSGSPGLIGSPLPPPRPAEFGPSATAIPEADLPAANAVAVQGQVPAPDVGFDFGGALTRFRDRGGFDLLGSVGVGLLGAPTWREGLAGGLQNYEKSLVTKAGTDLARAELAIKQQKLAKEGQGQNATVEFLVQNGHPRATAQAMVAASAAGNREALANAMSNAVPKREAISGYTVGADGRAQFIPGGPQDPATIEAQAKARATDSTLRVLSTPEERAAAGIKADDPRTARIDPNGRVSFDPAPPAPVVKQFVIGGAKVDRVLNPNTGQWENPSFGANPPQAQAQLDNSDVPPGVDPATYRREMAKAVVGEQRGATQRATQAASALPILERAERAYTRLGQNGGIGPVAASGINRTITGAFGAQNEIDRQEFEAASKELELLQAQIRMKGQGSVTDSERRLLALTLPRLDAASPETGLNTLRGMRAQFGNAMGADKLPSYGMGRTGEAPVPARAAPASQGMSQPPAAAIDYLRNNRDQRDAFDAKYGAGAAARVLGGQ